MRPLIGITCYVETARFTVWETTASLLPHQYLEQIVAAGGQPVIVPPVGEPAALAGRLDGLIVAGGGDVAPTRYGERAHPSTGYVREFRDEAEFALVDAALERGLPFLGVCRGLQVLNVALGGTLHQHLPDVVGHTGHSPRRAATVTCRSIRSPGPGWPRRWALRRSRCRTTTTRRSRTWPPG